MAQWSKAAHEQKVKEQADKVAARIAAFVNQRMEMFKRFRDADWTIYPVKVGTDTRLSDNHPDAAVHFYVKMPGAHYVHVNTWAALERLVRGV